MRKQLYATVFTMITVATLAIACIRPFAVPTPAAQSATAAPIFTHPTAITHPFYPVSRIAQTITLGQKDGKSVRVEVTALPETKLIAWGGQQTEARALQFLACTEGKLVEMDYAYVAQADDGSVYSLGEDVSNYVDGQVVNHDGSWLVGQNGALPGLLMPAQPTIGQIFQPANLPGVGLETVEVLSLTEKIVTPNGPTDKGMLVKETLMDGSIEHKIYAADFGVVAMQAQAEQLNLVWFNRTDANPSQVPASLSSIEAEAEDLIDVAPGGNWARVADNVAAITTAWQAYLPQTANDHAPQPFQAALTTALDRLQKSAATKDTGGALQAANDLSAALIDLIVVYQPAMPTDLGWLDVLERQVWLDVAGDDFTAATNTLAKTNAIWARLKPVVLATNGAAVATRFENSLAIQQQALNQKNAAALTMEAKNGLELVDALEQLF